MENNRENQGGNPHEENLKAKIHAERMQAIKNKAANDFRDKPVSESLYTSYEVANVSSYLIDLFSIVTGAFAIFYLLHSQFGNLPIMLVYGISIGFAILGAVLLQYGKRQNLKILLPYFFKYRKIKWGAALVQLPLAAASILLTFYCCSVFPSFMNEVEGLEDLAVLESKYKNQIDSLDSRIAVVTSGLTYKYGAKKGEVKTGASKLLKDLENNRIKLVADQKTAIDEARTRNEAAVLSHNDTQDSKGYLLAWVSVVLELIIFQFCLGFYYYYEFLVSKEFDLSPSVNHTNKKDLNWDDLLREMDNNAPKNSTDNNFFFRTDNHNKNIDTPVITGKTQAFKLVVLHEKEDGSQIEMDKTKVAVRVRGYRTRLAEKIAEIQKEGYNQKRGAELSNRFHKLDYWVRKQNDLMNIYDDNLKIV